MKPAKEILLALTGGGMETAWRYAWSSFLSIVILQRPFPLPLALGAFIAAAFFTRLPRKRNWRRLQAVFLHTAGFVSAALLTAHHIFFREFNFFNGAWITELGRQLKNPQQWFIIVPIFCCLLLFWLGGRTWEKTPRDYLPVCLQFDKGLGAFFLLFLVEFLIQEKGGTPVEDPAGGFLMIAFLLFGLFSIGLARARHDARKSFLDGYHGIGIILGFTTIVVLCGSALVMLTFPYLTRMADSAHGVLKEAAAPLGPIIVAILRFLFAPNRFRVETGGSGTTGSGADAALAAAGGGWEQTLLQAISWGLAVMLGLLAAGFCGYLVYRLIRWLLKRAPSENANPQSSGWLLNLSQVLISLLRSFWHKVLFLLGDLDSAAAVYTAILRWGRRSGQPPVHSETPIEYGSRLMHGFPKLKEEIGLIIEAFNREVYGEIATDRQALSRIASALRRMRSPRHWPSRIRGWFLQQSSRIQPSK